MPPKGDTKGKPTGSTDQYHHYIPRFILRRYQVGPARPKAERQRLFRRTGIDPEYVYYWDVAKNTLELRSIGQVYGVRNLYQDCKNTDNVNAAERKLSVLEHKAAMVISDLHAALPTGRFSVKRRPLEDLRKFLYVMHYRSSRLVDVYFDENHPDNVPMRPWIIHCKKTHGFKSPAEMWLHMLNYYLDNSHSQLMTHAAGITDKYGMGGVMGFMLPDNQVPPEIEHFPAISYQTNCGGHYTCIWQAADEEEFVLTHNGFGLWEGRVDGQPYVHRIFIISPRVIIVLRSVVLTIKDFTEKMAPSIQSSLLEIENGPPTCRRTQEFPDRDTVTAMENYRSSKQADGDVFTFNIKKLTVTQTMEVNSVLLDNVRKDGSVTFVSKTNMLRTARTFSGVLYHVFCNPRIFGLLNLLQDDLKSENASGIDAMKVVHFELFGLLLDASTGNRTFASAYERARKVLAVIVDQIHFSSVFASEIEERVGTVCARFLSNCDGDKLPPYVSWIETLPLETSTALFPFVFAVMEGSGFARAPSTSPLDVIQDEAVVLTFLEHVSVNVDGWYKLMTNDAGAALILSQLFEEGTTPDDVMMTLVTHIAASPQKCNSHYERACVLHRAICVSGPMRNKLTMYCSSSIAAIVTGLSLIIPSNKRSEQPNARLSNRLSQAHWLQLVQMIKDSMGQGEVSFTSGRGELPSSDIRHMADDVIVVGVLLWMAKERSDFLDNFCRPRKILLVKKEAK